MFSEDHAWRCGFIAKIGKRKLVNIQKKRFFRKNKIEKGIDDFLFFNKKTIF